MFPRQSKLLIMISVAAVVVAAVFAFTTLRMGGNNDDNDNNVPEEQQEPSNGPSTSPFWRDNTLSSSPSAPTATTTTNTPTASPSDLLDLGDDGDDDDDKDQQEEDDKEEEEALWIANQTAVPDQIFQELFGQSNREESPIFSTTAGVLPETQGIFPAVNRNGDAFFVEISSILVSSNVLNATLFDEDEDEDDSEEEEEEEEEEVSNNNNVTDLFTTEDVSTFVFRGFFNFNGTSSEIVAISITFASIVPSETSLVAIIYDPTDPLYDLTEESFGGGEVDLLATRTRKLDEETMESSFLLQIDKKNDEHDYHDNSAANLLARQRVALQDVDVPNFLQCWSGSQPSCCIVAISEAIDAANCQQPPEQPYVNQSCTSKAQELFDQGREAAREEYKDKLQKAKAVKLAFQIRTNYKRIKEFAKLMAVCLVVGAISGPVGYAACVARAIAVTAAKYAAVYLAIDKTFEEAKSLLIREFVQAMEVACSIFRVALFACVSCVTCENPDQVPCGDTCYDPNSQKCCPDEAIANVDGCCPNEKECPDGHCIPSESCCPGNKMCYDRCIPTKDCCTPDDGARRSLRQAREVGFLGRSLQSEDPCCESPDHPCCGSEDPCCGSHDPCCGSKDPCCGSADKCCGSFDPCCGLASCAGVIGDPHVTTFGGLRYDCHGRGEFILVEAGNAKVHGRFRMSGRVAVTSGVAMTDGVNRTIVELSLPVDGGGGPVLVIDGAIIHPPSRGYEDGNVLVLSTTGSDTGPFRVTYKGTLLSIFVGLRFSTRFGGMMTVMVGLPPGLRNHGTVGLLGSADKNPRNDWMTRTGTILPIPLSREDRVGAVSLEYCLENWCIESENDTLFTYYDPNYNFEFFFGCNDTVRDTVDISMPSPEAQELCGFDEACLVDFVEGSREVAGQTLLETATLDGVFTTGSLLADPATIGVNVSVNVALSIDTRDNAESDTIEEYFLFRVDSQTGDSLHVRPILVLSSNGHNDGVFSNSLNFQSTFAGEEFGFRAVPVINGVLDSSSPATILRMATVRSFSGLSGALDKDEKGGSCEGPCDDGNPCTIDFCLNSICRTEPMACGIGQSCDPFSATCQDDENLVPCVAVIDEWDSRNYASEWASFRERFPTRPFCLLIPNGGIQTLPTGFDLDTVNNPDGMDRTIVSTVNRDNGNSNLAQDWFATCQLDQFPPESVRFVGLFVDNSGSMRVSTVQASLSLFESRVSAAGMVINRVVNAQERWIDPFVTTLVPAGG